LTGKQQGKRRQHPPLTENERERLGIILRQETARHRALYLVARGRSYRQIAGDPQMLRALDRVVSAARIKQLIEHVPSDEQWIEDVEYAKREWCVHLRTADDEGDRICWNEVVFPRLLARSSMKQARWWDEHAPAEPAERAVTAASASKRQWKLDLRDHIMGHLYFRRYPEVPPISPSSFAVRELARTFGLSPRHTCRVLRDYRQAMEREYRCLSCRQIHRDIRWHVRASHERDSIGPGYICGREYLRLSDEKRKQWFLLDASLRL
jgi:hypothetical protein